MCLFLAVSITSCVEKAVPVPIPTQMPSASVPDVVLHAPSVPFVVSIEDFEVLLPSNEWRQVVNSKPEIKFLAKNDKLNNLVVVVKEKFSGSYDDYALTNIRGLKDQGAVIVKADQSEFGGAKWVFVSSSNDGVNLFQWITYRDGYGYALSCGGQGVEEQATVCQQIASTLKLN